MVEGIDYQKGDANFGTRDYEVGEIFFLILII